MYDLVVKGGLLLTPNFSVTRADIGVRNGVIVTVGEVKGTADVSIDARGKLIMPGLINTHTHLAMTLLRGYADDLPLERWLKEKIWPIEKKLKPKHVYAGALLGCVEMIKSGTTCFVDMYFHMEEVAKAIEKSGLRGFISYGIIELGDPARMETEIAKGLELFKWRSERVGVLMGPHAPYTCSDDCLLKVKEIAKRFNTKVHIHLSETKSEVEEFKSKTGLSPVEHLCEIGFLGPEVLAAHCVHLSSNDIKILAREGVKVSHNPTSNLKLGAGVAPVRELMDAGVLVGLGTDGPASNNSLDMFREMKTCAILQKARLNNPASFTAKEALKMATENGGTILGINCGRIEVGARADLILVNLKSPHLRPIHDVISSLVYAATGSDVDTTIVDGKVLMHNRTLLTLSEEDVIDVASEAAQDLIQ